MKTKPTYTPRRRRVLYASRLESHETLTGICRYARQAGWIVDWGVHNIRLDASLVRWDGIITHMDDDPGPLRRFVERAQAPVVDLGAAQPDLRVPRVILDDEAIGRMAAEHLVERGFQFLATFAEREGDMYRLRREGFSAVARKAGRSLYRMRVAPELSWGTPSSDDYQRLIRAVRTLPLPIGIMAATDTWAVALVNACLMAGLRLPEHVAVVGADNQAASAEFAAVPITCVIANHAQHGFEAAALLDQLMQGGDAPQLSRRVPPAGIELRRSTNTVAVHHAGVARAVRCILERYREPLSVAHVARAAVMSPSHLFREFPRHTGRTVHEMINFQRMAHACRLLRETTRPMDEVADLSGFPGARRMAKVFRRELRCAPREYRRAVAAEA